MINFVVLGTVPRMAFTWGGRCRCRYPPVQSWRHLGTPIRETENPAHCEVSVAKDALAPGGDAAGAVRWPTRR